MSRIRFYMAGLTALLVGMPLTDKAYAGTDDIVWSATDLGLAIAESSEGVS